jgi:hypothetical protein
MRWPVAVSFVAIAVSLAGQEPKAAITFERDIAPILLQRCVNCHGAKEQKGDLRLDRREHLFPADSEGEGSVVPGKPADSEMLRRLRLPVDDDERMPAKGEPLTAEQIARFEQWIADGAEWPTSGDAWIERELAAAVLPKVTFELPAATADEQAAIVAATKSLTAGGAIVQAVAADTVALEVNLSLLGKIDGALLAQLAPLAGRLVWLNLGRSNLGDEQMEALRPLTQLRRLHLGGTAVTDRGLGALQGLARLEYLNLHGTAVSDAGVAALAGLSRLQHVYLWQTKVTAAGKATLLAKSPQLEVDLGDYVDTRLAAAAAEVAARAARDRPINAHCPVTDKPVDATKTSRLDQRVVAFCCADCKAAFDKEPAKYAGKLPAPKKN